MLDKVKLSSFLYCIIGYIAFPFLIVSDLLYEIPEIIVAIISIPLVAVGLLMQIIPGQYLTQLLIDKLDANPKKASNFAWAIWITILIVYGLFTKFLMDY